MSRLAIFLPSLAGGGAERAMLNLAAGFRDLGHAVDLVVATSAGPYRDELPAGVDLVDLGCPRVIRALPGLARYLRRRQPQRLYAAMEHANLVALWARRLARVPTRVVVSVRDSGTGPEVRRDLRQRLCLPLARRFYPQADAVVAVSAGTADVAAAELGLDRRRIAAIPNPVLTPDLAARAAEPPCHPWLADAGPPVILAAGRLAPQKDFATLLEAFATLRARRPARLLILGEGPERPRLEALAATLRIATDTALPGFAPNPFACMASAAAFTLSSRHEGSPNVLVQALACGCPVVSTDCPSGPAEILDGVPQGRLVPVGNPAAMAEALDAVLDLPRPLPPPRLERFDYLAAARGYLAAAG